LPLKLSSEADCLTESGMSFQILGTQQERLLCPKLLLQSGKGNKFWLSERRDHWGWWATNTEER